MRFGNVVGCSTAADPPTVVFKDGKGGFTSLLIVNLDGNAFEEEEEVCLSGRRQIVQWLVTNIADGASTDSGDTIISYQQPVPYYGTGFHRVAIVLFRHNEPIDAKDLALKGTHLSDRLFNSNQFLKRFEEVITPSALRFSQMEWDETCDELLSSIGMKSPRFWYEWNRPLKPEQKEFPMKPMPFDRYLDMYRDPAEVRQTVAREWLERRVLEGPVVKPKYPDIFYAEHRKELVPWVHRRLMEKNMGQGIYSRLYSDYVNPAFQARIEEEQRKADEEKKEEVASG